MEFKNPLAIWDIFEGTLEISSLGLYNKTGYIKKIKLPGCQMQVLGSELESFPLTRNQHHHPKLQEAENK